MQPVVPALFPFGRGVGDGLPGLLPPHLIATPLHLPDEISPRPGPFHTLVDGVHQLELPALTPNRRAVLTGTHLLFLGVLLRWLQHTQTVGHTDLVIDLPLPLEVCGVLVELVSILPAHAVDDQVIVEVLGIHMGGNHHLVLREQPLCQFQPDGVDLLRGDLLRRIKGLYELVEHPAVCFFI